MKTDKINKYVSAFRHQRDIQKKITEVLVHKNFLSKVTLYLMALVELESRSHSFFDDKEK